MILFLLVELIFANTNPDLQSWAIYHAPHKRLRLPTSTHPPEDAALEVGDLETLIASHIVSEPKSADEYRVLILGDSAVWGFLLDIDQTLPEQLNAMGMKSCGGKRLRFYNLSYPFASVTKDLMILDKAMAYKPDMIVWTLSLVTVMYKARTIHWLLPQNPDELESLNARFHFLPPDHRANSRWEVLVIRHRKLRQILRYQLASLIPEATGEEQFYPATYQTVPTELVSDLEFEGLSPPTLRPKRLAIDEIQDAYELSGGLPILLVNEPILIVPESPNSDIRYDGYYPRWAYDQYRQIMAQAAAQSGWDYLDLWDLIPASYFTNTPLHINAAGESLLAAALAPSIQRLACP